MSNLFFRLIQKAHAQVKGHFRVKDTGKTYWVRAHERHLAEHLANREAKLHERIKIIKNADGYSIQAADHDEGELIRRIANGLGIQTAQETRVGDHFGHEGAHSLISMQRKGDKGARDAARIHAALESLEVRATTPNPTPVQKQQMVAQQRGLFDEEPTAPSAQKPKRAPKSKKTEEPQRFPLWSEGIQTATQQAPAFEKLKEANRDLQIAKNAVYSWVDSHPDWEEGDIPQELLDTRVVAEKRAGAIGRELDGIAAHVKEMWKPESPPAPQKAKEAAAATDANLPEELRGQGFTKDEVDALANLSTGVWANANTEAEKSAAHKAGGVHGGIGNYRESPGKGFAPTFKAGSKLKEWAAKQKDQVGNAPGDGFPWYTVPVEQYREAVLDGKAGTPKEQKAAQNVHDTAEGQSHNLPEATASFNAITAQNHAAAVAIARAQGLLAVGETRSIDGVTYQLNENHRWERLREPAPTEPPTPVAPKSDPTKRTKVAAKLREVAQSRLDEAEEASGRDRNMNTQRRIRMGSSAINAANEMEAMAKSAIHLADAIESGAAPALERVGTWAGIQTLDAAARGAMFARLRAARDDSKRWSAPDNVREPEPEDLPFARLPQLRLHAGHAPSYIENLIKAGNKTAASELAALADAAPSAVDGVEPFLYLPENLAHAIVKTIGNKAWHVTDAVTVRDRLAKYGIKTDTQLQAALAEYLMYRKGAKGMDPIKKAELALVGTRIPGYFPTPDLIADDMIEAAGIEPGMSVLEPSAGKGTLADRAKAAGGEVDAIEVNHSLQSILEAKGHTLAGSDFTEYKPGKEYDRIVMNPPFENGQDMQHVQLAFGMLKPGGRIVSIMSAGTFFRSDKQATAFRAWLRAQGGTFEKLPDASFMASDIQTGVSTYLVTIDKPAAVPVAVEASPKEGDVNAEGLIFHNSRWHREQEIEAEKARATWDAAVAADLEKQQMTGLGSTAMSEREDAEAAERIEPDPRPGNYYVSAIDGTKRYFIAGPYSTHQAALGHVKEVWALAEKRDPKAVFMSWGTARSEVDDPRKTPLGPYGEPEAEGYRNGQGMVFRDGKWEKAEEAAPAKAPAPTAEIMPGDTVSWPEDIDTYHGGGARTKGPRINKGTVVHVGSAQMGLSGTPFPSVTILDNFGTKHTIPTRLATVLAQGLRTHTAEGNYKDFGAKIGGARKDMAALKLRYDREGAGAVTMDDADLMEEDPGFAARMITRERVLQPKEALSALKDAGASSGAAYIYRRLMNAIPPKPEDSPAARKLFVAGCQRVQEAFALVRTVDDASAVRDELKSEWGGIVITPDIAEENKRLSATEETTKSAYWKGRQSTMTGVLEYKTRQELGRAWEESAEGIELKKASDLAVDSYRAFIQQARDSAQANPWNTSLAMKSFGAKFSETIGDTSTAITYAARKAISGRSESLRRKARDLERANDWTWFNDETGTAPRAPQEKRKVLNWEREGPDVVQREGGTASVFTSKELSLTFGFRGIEYGNWVDEASAAAHTQHAGEALSDLSTILGVDPKTVSLNGRLALAFGARGTGRALAHYESSTKAINLTKFSGGGCLAHEWGHALDNVMAMASWDGTQAHSSFASHLENLGPSMPEAVKNAFSGVMDAISTGDHTSVLIQLKAGKTKFLPHAASDALLQASGGDPGKAMAEWAKERTVDVLRRYGASLRPNGARWQKDFEDKARKQARYFLSVSGQRSMAFALPNIDPNAVGVSSYAATANDMGEYWKRPHELFARAWEAFVEDELTSRGRKNTYLVHGTTSTKYVRPGVEATGISTSVYPQGEERTRINAAMRKLVDQLVSTRTIQKAIKVLDRASRLQTMLHRDHEAATRGAA